MKTLTVFETVILHASDVLYWLDGTTAENASDMERVPGAIELEVSTAPSDLKLRHTPGRTAMWRRMGASIVAGEASVEELARPAPDPFAFVADVFDPRGRYNPRRLNLTAGSGEGHACVLYPSPSGTRLGRGGGVFGTLLFADDGRPVAWAVLTLTVTTALNVSLRFRAQADKRGDFMIPLNRLPALPESIEDYTAQLELSASASADADAPVDPADLVPMQIGHFSNDDGFAVAVPLRVVPGEVRRLQSHGSTHVSVLAA
ncbi:hypothetical protein [Halomonas sp. BM-2019]|uniref:hypothetical protein n=1 Tax=Halomonas sp. BM-2019 TaxID=2811227 RepID=UPI001B3C28E7|nr:MAG: hypothetical protein J5F18_09840 [Halomonas sp. BM-2019]